MRLSLLVALTSLALIACGNNDDSKSTTGLPPDKTLGSLNQDEINQVCDFVGTLDGITKTCSGQKAKLVIDTNKCKQVTPELLAQNCNALVGQLESCVDAVHADLCAFASGVPDGCKEFAAKDNCRTLLGL